MKRNSHCSYCGHKFEDGPWPRTCTNPNPVKDENGADVFCRNISYINPIPVVVLIVLVLSGKGLAGILTVRRGENPGKGKLALPGGFLDVGETWEEGAVRELREETGIVFDAKCVKLLAVKSAIEDRIGLIFFETPPVPSLPEFKPNPEVLELVVLDDPEELAFQTHTEVLEQFFVDRVWGHRRFGDSLTNK